MSSLNISSLLGSPSHTTQSSHLIYGSMHLQNEKVHFVANIHAGEFSFIDDSVPGNRLYERPDGSIGIKEKSLLYLLGEKLLAPTIGKTQFFVEKTMGLLGKGLEHVNSGLSRFHNFNILPVVSAQSAPCEWGKAEKILMHQPGHEVEVGVYHPQAALFEKYFDVNESVEEHRAYAKLLRESGATVDNVLDILLKGTEKENSKELRDLRNFSKRFLNYTYDISFTEEEIEQHERYRMETISQMSPEQLVKVIMDRPTVHLKKTDKNTFLEASYRLSPVMNMYFLRDQMITTSKGVVICRMNSSQRFPEVEIIKFVLDKMEIKPICEIVGEGRLEGGDFLPAGKLAFIGQGLRTNPEAISQLIKKDAFGDIETLVVVKDSYKNQDQMHLDTYFNIVDERRAVLIETRLHGKFQNPEIATTIDIYSRDRNGKYTLKFKDNDFVDYLRETLKFDIIPVTNEDQLKYGINFLTLESNKLLGVDGISKEYKDLLRSKNIDATWMDFSSLTSGFGAAHCTTQVLKRVGCDKSHVHGEL